MILEICSYTDQRGSDSSNILLSQHRANRVKEYLLTRGIAPWSVPAVGYGETQPIWPEKVILAEKDQDERENLYQQNRRIEFRILRTPLATFTLRDSIVSEDAVMRAYILYDLSKCSVRPESYPLLDSLVTFMQTHPDVIVEIGNHTDTRGSDASNIRLTQCRSKDVVHYLVQKGIPEWRVIYRGYGESAPIVAEKYVNAVPSKQGRDELHQVNRRTDIKILKAR
jgi:outer membrane protein OmpA-like peptidoglycan-associated protein